MILPILVVAHMLSPTRPSDSLRQRQIKRWIDKKQKGKIKKNPKGED